ncbi:hypothetical protein [Marinobacter salarius]|jgi:hypothetical protein|uniref:hypothetical protein n=1 Tax=Marinobacter salarius TaxID=1420917 RepID=UPI0032137569
MARNTQPVTNQVVLSKRVIVRAIWRRRYRNRKIENLGFEDSLWSEQGHAMAVEVNALLQGIKWENVTVTIRELTQEIENLCSN